MSLSRAPREAPPPGWFGRSAGGLLFELTLLSRRDARGRKLYRLWFPSVGVRGSQEWTLRALLDSRVQFFTRKPKTFGPEWRRREENLRHDPNS